MIQAAPTRTDLVVPASADEACRPDTMRRHERPSMRSFSTSSQANGLTPSKAADRRTLIRRVYYDLLGIPAFPRRGGCLCRRQISPERTKN